MVNRLKSLSNPQAMINNALQRNPQIAQLIKQHNGNAKEAFYDLAQQKGVDPDEILSMFQ